MIDKYELLLYIIACCKRILLIIHKRIYMKKMFFLATVLFASTFAHTTKAFDKAEVRSVINALFSYNTQDQQSKDEINGLVDEVHKNGFNNGNDYWRYDVRSGALKVIDQAILWIGEKGYNKARVLIGTKYAAHFAVPKGMSDSDIATYAAEMGKEKEAVAKYVARRVKMRAESLATRRREDIKYNWINTTSDVVNIVKSTLRTYVGSQLKDRAEDEIRNALNQFCSICQEQGTQFPSEFFCGHWMHRACYNQWKATRFAEHLHATCPVCRRELEYYTPAVTVIRHTPDSFFEMSVSFNDSQSSSSFSFRWPF
jgi:hypothetical protein